MSSNVLIFPAASSCRTLQLAEPSLNRARRIHLCERTHCERTHDQRMHDQRASRPLELAAQVGLTVSHVNRGIAKTTERDRQRRFLDPADDTPNIPA